MKLVENAVRLTRSDACLMTALLRPDQPRVRMSLSTLIDRADWLDTMRPSFHELSYGLARLVAAGLVAVEVDGDGKHLVGATPLSDELLLHVVAAPTRSRGEVLAAIADALGVPPYPELEVEDRTLGGLPGLTREEVEVGSAES